MGFSHQLAETLQIGSAKAFCGGADSRIFFDHVAASIEDYFMKLPGMLHQLIR